jgi:hypothetical protein
MEILLILIFGLACGAAGWSVRGFVEDRLTVWEVDQNDDTDDDESQGL